MNKLGLLGLLLLGSTAAAQTPNYSTGSAKVFQGVSNCAAYTGLTLDVQVNACLLDAMNRTNGNYTGTADARGLTGARNPVATITVGNSAGTYVHLIPPCSGSWQFTMTGGTSDGIVQYGGTDVSNDCPVAGISASFYFGNTGGSLLNSIYHMVGSATPYITASGFNVLNSSGNPTASHYSMIIDGNGSGGPFADASLIKNVNAFDTSNTAGGPLLLRNGCCGLTIAHGSFNAGGAGIPITEQADSTSYLQGVTFFDDTIVNPGSGKPLVLCTDSRSPHNSYSYFDKIYDETNLSDTTIPFFSSPSATPCSLISIRDLLITSNVANSTAALINAPSTTVTLDNIQYAPGVLNFSYPIPTVVTGQTVPTDANGHLNRWP